MRILLFTLCVCLPAAAEEPLGPVLEQLRSDDPGRRAEAREKLMSSGVAALPRLREYAEQETDPEGKCAAQEIAEELSLREMMPRIRKFLSSRADEGVEDWMRQGGAATLDMLAHVAASARRLEQEIAESDPFGQKFQRGNADPTDVLRLEALAWMKALTLADFGTRTDEWRRFVEAHAKDSWQEVRLAGLESGGYAVRDPDPGTASREWLRAWNDLWANASLFENGGRLARTAEWVSLESAAREALSVDACFEGDAEYVKAPRAIILQWLVLNAGHFRREKGVLVPTLDPAAYAARLGDADPDIRCAALRSLWNHPDAIPAEGWALLGDDALLTFRVMSRSKHLVAAADMPAALRAVPDPFDRPDLACVWDPDRLRAVVDDRVADPERRWRALRWLIVRGEPRTFTLPAADAGGGAPEAYANPQRAALDAALGNDDATRSVLIDAAMGNAAELDRVEAWLAKARVSSKTWDIAVVLASRGRKPGLDAIVDRAAGDILSALARPMLRATVEGAPEGDLPGDWRKWGQKGSARFEWDPVRQKWESAK